MTNTLARSVDADGIENLPVRAAAAPVRLEGGLDIRACRLPRRVDLLQLSGDLDEISGAALADYTARIRPERVCGIAVDVRRIDFAGLRGIMHLVAGLTSLAERGIHYRVAGATGALSRALSLTGADARLLCAPTVELAVAELVRRPIARGEHGSVVPHRAAIRPV